MVSQNINYHILKKKNFDLCGLHFEDECFEHDLMVCNFILRVWTKTPLLRNKCIEPRIQPSGLLWKRFVAKIPKKYLEKSLFIS